jgi:hypothetical protein
MAHHKPRPRSLHSTHSTVCVECRGVLLKALGPHSKDSGGWAHIIVNDSLVHEEEFSMMEYLDQADFMSVRELRTELELKNRLIREMYDKGYRPV